MHAPLSFLSVKTERGELGVDGPASTAGSTSFVYTLMLGMSYGFLHIIGPDHLGTLMSLSAACTPRRAFTVGAAWSLGHCLGMVVIALTLAILQKLTNVDVESWEHFGDYVIGVSLVLCGLYFVIREDQYLQEAEDGTVTLKSCECCIQVPAPAGYGATDAEEPGLDRMPARAASRKPHHGRGKFKPCADYTDGRACSADHNHMTSDNSCTENCCAEEAPGPCVEPKKPEAAKGGNKIEGSGKDYAASLLGIFQGMCCPMGLVGITFIASLPPAGVLVFLLSFLLVSAIGTGFIAACWAMLLRAQVCSSASSKAMYRTSCYFTLLLGITWIIANACGVLDALNYAEHKHAGPGMVVMTEPAVKVG